MAITKCWIEHQIQLIFNFIFLDFVFQAESSQFNHNKAVYAKDTKL